MKKRLAAAVWAMVLVLSIGSAVYLEASDKWEALAAKTSDEKPAVHSNSLSPVLIYQVESAKAYKAAPAPAVPKTGERIGMFFVFLLTAACAAGIVYVVRKRENF